MRGGRQASVNKSTTIGISRGKNITSTIHAPGLFLRLRGDGEKIVAQPETKEAITQDIMNFFIIKKMFYYLK